MDSPSPNGHPTPPPRPITVIINAHSRRGKLEYARAIHLLRATGLPLADSRPAVDKARTVRLLEREVKAGANTVIVGGGDGTLSMCAGYLALTPVAMGVLPMGTGNTFARSMGLPLDLTEAARTIAQGHIEEVDVGRVNGKIFLNSVTLGLSVQIAQALDHETKQRLGLLSWPLVGARIAAVHRPLAFQITSVERTFRLRTHQLVVSNGRYLAGPVPSTPNASLQDSCLRVFSLGNSGLDSLVRAALDWLRGRHTQVPGNHYLSTHALKIESLLRPTKADVDGEICMETPLEIEVLPRALRVVVSEGFRANKV